LPPHVLEGIAHGRADIAAGRFITLEEFKKKFLSSAEDSTSV
jgi:predicted transcriptional regulator